MYRSFNIMVGVHKKGCRKSVKRILLLQNLITICSVQKSNLDVHK